DSLALTKGPTGAPALDSVVLAQAVRRARDAGIASARDWLASQPDNAHAQNAFLFSLVAANQFEPALRELDRLTVAPEGRDRADLAFLRARVLSEQGERREAVRTVARVMGPLRPRDFALEQLPIEALGEVTGGAGLLGYAGKVELAGRNLDLAAELSATFLPANLGSRRVGRRTLYGHLLQSHLYTALGAPADQLKPIWDQVADSARRAPKASRAQIINFGWAAALGLFLQNPADPTPLDELQALDGVNAPPELRALSAID